MDAEEVYKHFGTPKGLQDHMLWVAGLVCTLRDHWSGETVDWDSAIKAALLHDIGNVIKFDLDKFPQLLGNELPRIDFWRAEQKRLIAKYGGDDHEATDRMLDELSVRRPIREATQSKSFGNSKPTAASTNWLVKILFYCDLRVLPDGVGTLSERVAEFRDRLKKYSERPDFPELIAACHDLEGQIQSSVDTNLDGIMTQPNADRLRQQMLAYNIK